MRTPFVRLSVSLSVAIATILSAGTACAQSNVIKFGVAEYTTHSRSNGITGVGVPPGADAETGDAPTVIVEYERLITPNVGVELALGIPPRIKARATGSVAFLGDDVLSARNVSPVLLMTYHFGSPGDKWRPYVGVGANYTTFRSIKSRLAPKVEMGDSYGWAAKGGIEYVVNQDWSVFASVTALKVKTKLVASGATVLQTTIDIRPVIYTLGAAYRF
ncbi:MAG TPA: OmpW family outer membrane protein [Burkholderiaceae bacterium]|nr:OmpW family outer membrane protein [Burkholderiaceae bacterium]